MYGGESRWNHYADFSEITFDANGTGTFRDSLTSEEIKESGEFDWVWASGGIMDLSDNDTVFTSLFFKEDLKIFTIGEPEENAGSFNLTWNGRNDLGYLVAIGNNGA